MIKLNTHYIIRILIPSKRCGVAPKTSTLLEKLALHLNFKVTIKLKHQMIKMNIN